MTLDIDDDCIMTLESLMDEIRDIEKVLTKRFNLDIQNGLIRDQLYKMDRENNLIEDEVVARWLELRTIYEDWLRHP